MGYIRIEIDNLTHINNENWNIIYGTYKSEDDIMKLIHKLAKTFVSRDNGKVTNIVVTPYNLNHLKCKIYRVAVYYVLENISKRRAILKMVSDEITEEEYVEQLLL